MPCIKDDSTVEALAQAFTSNGRNQEQAMLEVGYAPAYANSYCGTMWENERLIAAIGRIDSEKQTRSDYNYDESMRRKQVLLDAMMPTGEVPGDITAYTAKTCNTILKQMDNISGLEQQHSYDHGEQPAPMSEDKRRALIEALKIVEAGPKLAKDTG